MGALNKQEAAKKGAKKESLHTEPVHTLPKAVDWDEQERILASLKGKFMPPIPRTGRGGKVSKYNPDLGAELCILRRSGLNKRQIALRAGVSYPTINTWLNDYPEFAQEWDDGYRDYVIDLAEEMPSIAENLLKSLRRDGKKLSDKQHSRYMRGLEFLAEQVKFAAVHRARNLYGDAEGGMELVLVQPTNIPAREVTQDKARAEAWKEEAKEAEDAEVGLPDPDDADGAGSGLPGEADSPRPERGGVPADDEGTRDVGRDEGGDSGVAEPGEPIEDAGAGPRGD